MTDFENSLHTAVIVLARASKYCARIACGGSEEIAETAAEIDSALELVQTDYLDAIETELRDYTGEAHADEIKATIGEAVQIAGVINKVFTSYTFE